MKAYPRAGVIACRVFEDEIAHLVGDETFLSNVRFLEVGLHDRPGELRKNLQVLISEFDRRNDLEAVVLAYGLCGCGSAGLQAGRHPLVIPRAHDCMTFFLGSREAYSRRQADAPDTYYFTPGWMRAGRTPGSQRLERLKQEFAQRFEPDEVEYLVGVEVGHWKRHGQALYLDLGTPGAGAFAEEAARSAAELGWTFERRTGDGRLLSDLLTGPWDEERFQTVPPGEVLRHKTSEEIFTTVKRERDDPDSDPQTRDVG